MNGNLLLDGLELEPGMVLRVWSWTGKMKGASESHSKDPFRLSCLKQKISPVFSLWLLDRNTAITIELQGKQQWSYRESKLFLKG